VVRDCSDKAAESRSQICGKADTMPSPMSRPPLIHCHTSVGTPMSEVLALRISVNTTIDAPRDAVMM
jgi:hypothetical protein